MFWFFGHVACGILAPQPGVEPAPLELEGKVLTTGPPEKSLDYVLEDECGKTWISLSLITNKDHMLDILFLSKPCQIHTPLFPFFCYCFQWQIMPMDSQLLSCSVFIFSLLIGPKAHKLQFPDSFAYCFLSVSANGRLWQETGRQEGKLHSLGCHSGHGLCIVLFLLGSFRPKHCSGFLGWHHLFSSSCLSNTC